MPSKKNTAKNVKTEKVEVFDAKTFVENHKFHRKTGQEAIVQALIEEYPELATKPMELISAVNEATKAARKIKPPKTVPLGKLLRLIENAVSAFDGIDDQRRVVRGLASNPTVKGATTTISGLTFEVTADFLERLFLEGPNVIVLSAVQDKLPGMPDLGDIDARIAELEEELRTLRIQRTEALNEWRAEAQAATGVEFGPDGLPIVEVKSAVKRTTGKKISDYRGYQWKATKRLGDTEYNLLVGLDSDGKIYVKDTDTGEVLVQGESPSGGQASFREVLGLGEAHIQNAVAFWHAPDDTDELDAFNPKDFQ